MLSVAACIYVLGAVYLGHLEADYRRRHHLPTKPLRVLVAGIIWPVTLVLAVGSVLVGWKPLGDR